MEIFEHPGKLVRLVIENERETVTSAAKRLGVGRPALSRMLNGKADLSLKMAFAVEKEFGLSAEAMLTGQLYYNIKEHKTRSNYGM